MALAGWFHRFKLTIDSSVIDDPLSDFPVMIRISSSTGKSSHDMTAIFDEIGSNRKKIAVATDADVECYVEIEKWDESGEEAILWVKIPSIASGIDTVLYIYYDSAHADNDSYVGDITDAVSRNVWDDDFVGVWHMSQDPSGGADAIKDSTSNSNHGTSAGSMTIGDLVNGKAGKALEFDGTDDNITIPDNDIFTFSNDINDNYPFTISAVVNADLTGNFPVVAKNSASGPTREYWFYVSNTGVLSLRFKQMSNSEEVLRNTSSPIVSDGVLTHVAAVYDGTESDPDDGIKLYVNGAEQAATGETEPSFLVMENKEVPLLIGQDTRGTSETPNYNFAKGIIDEVRISSTNRSAAWVKATYNTLYDSLVTYSGSYGDINVPAFQLPGVLAGKLLVELSASKLTLQGNISASLFTGAWVTAEAFDLSGSIEASSLYITLSTPVLASPIVLAGASQVSLLSPALSIIDSLGVSLIFAGPLISAQVFGLSSSLAGNQCIIVPAQMFATKTLSATLYVTLASPSLSLLGELSESEISVITLLHPIRRYFFTLTGAADGESNITIPISSFQTRMKSGDPTFLSVVIPGIDHAAQIAARSNGDLVIKMGYEVGGVVEIAEELVRVDLENIRIDEGGVNKSILLDGHRTVTYLNKEVNLSGASYRNLTKGKFRYRGEPDLYLRPGDTVSINDDDFVADNITMSISPANETMEISEV